MEPTSVFFLILFLAIFVLFVLNIARERAEQRAARIPEGWREVKTDSGFYWRRDITTIEYTGAGCIWVGALCEDIPLEVMAAFCARAKEWKR